MTLALLITAVTGAWAQTETLLTTITASSDFTSGSKTFDDKATVTFSGTVNYNSDDGWNFYDSAADPITMTITAAKGYTITSVILTIGDATLNDNEAPFVATLYGQSYYPKTTISDQASGIWGGVAKIEVYGTASAGIDVTTDAAEEGATFTEASFEMPTFDVTAEYELVRDMAISMPVTVGDGEDGYRIRIKKDGESFVPAEMTLQEMMGLYKVHDGIENQDLVFYGDGKVCDISIFAVDDQDQPTGDAIAFQDLIPGRYVAIATAADGSAYDGATEQSNVFVLYQGFPVVVPATEGEVGETVDLGTVSFYTEEFNLKLDPANQAKLYTLTAIDGSTVTATQVDVVPAGMPFFVLNEDDVDQMVTLIPADDNELPTTSPLVIAEFLGATEDLTFTQDDMDGAYNYYVLYKGAFVWVKDPGTLKAGKCYLRVPKNQPTTARRIVFGDATAVYDLNDKSEMINDNYYDLNGRKVNAPKKKGVYIQNGRKVVVK